MANCSSIAASRAFVCINLGINLDTNFIVTVVDMDIECAHNLFHSSAVNVYDFHHILYGTRVTQSNTCYIVTTNLTLFTSRFARTREETK